MRWVADGACRVTDPELFFPSASSDTLGLEIAMAKAVCRRCPVTTQCRDWAIATDQGDGIWGGLTRRERLALRRTSRVSPADIRQRSA